MKRWMLRAYAKINLGLRVLRKREDGYHELDTLLLQINLADQLCFERLGGGRFEFTCNWPAIPVDASNLCARAYEAIAAATGRRLGFRLHLHKNVPAGGGLGGGSSDAAVALMAINGIYRLGLSRAELHQLALTLGSDVPFFLEGGLCRGQGRGEILTPIDSEPPVTILVIMPELAVSTASVFKNIKLGLTKSHGNSTFALSKFDAFAGCDPKLLGVNDLEEVVFARYPQLAAIKGRLNQGGAIFANMSGSGAAVFGVFSRDSEALRLQQEFRSEYRTFIARPVRWGYDNVHMFLR